MCKHDCCFGMALLIACLCIATGCGTSTRVIEGSVTLDGKPLPSGAISFEPTDSLGRPFGGDILDGCYRIEIPPEQAHGTSVVRIMSPQPTGRKVPAGPPAARGATIDEIAEAIPAQYNNKSTLKVDLSTSIAHNFELSSHP
jgi:hypothetical protein